MAKSYRQQMREFQKNWMRYGWKIAMEIRNGVYDKPVSKINITKTGIINLLNESLPVKPKVIHLGDLQYYMINTEEINKFNKRFLFWMKEKKLEYRNSTFDCDNFALQWRAHMDLDYTFPFEVCGGEIWFYWDKHLKQPPGHAINWYIDADDFKLKFIEPQTGKPTTLPSSTFLIEQVQL